MCRASECTRGALHAQEDRRRTAVRSVSRTGLLSLSRHSAKAYRTATCKRRGVINRQKCSSEGELGGTASRMSGVSTAAGKQASGAPAPRG